MTPPHKAPAWLADGTTIEELQDELDRKGASAERIDAWRKAEELELKQAQIEGAESAVDAKARVMALQIMRDLASLRGMGFQCWCEAVLVFDVFCLRAPGHKGLEPAQLLVTSVAIVRLLEKSHHGIATRPPWVQDHRKLIAALLERLSGVMQVDLELEPSADVGDKMLIQRQIEVLSALGMKLTGRASFYDWISALGTRFSVLVRGKLAASLEWVWNYGMGGAQMLCWTVPASAEMPPQRVAVGLFALGLVCAGVLPQQAFQPPDLTEEEWTRRLCKCGPKKEGDVAAPVCHVPQVYWKSFIDILQVASRCNMEELQAHVSAVAAAVAAVGVEEAQ